MRPEPACRDDKSAITSDTGVQPAELSETAIARRVVVHFPGFEPLTAAQHHQRYRRAAGLSANAWRLDLQVHDLQQEAASTFFDVDCQADSGRVTSRIHILDHHEMVSGLTARSWSRRAASGFWSAATISLRGGLHRYFLCAWRFGLFFLFPYALVGAIAALSLSALDLAAHSGRGILIAVAAAAVVALVYVWHPLLRRMHVPLLLSNWKFALMLGGVHDRATAAWLERMAASARLAFDADADEFVITSHSMGSNVAVHVIGMLLEKEPDLFAGKRVVFVTMGGAVLQCALIGSAASLRARVGLIARQAKLAWIDVQCLTDPISFYRSRVVAAAGHPEAPQARIVLLRIRRMVSAVRYRKMRGNFLRTHRQYVLGSDFRHLFDFTYLTAGPETASAAGIWSAETTDTR